MEDRVYPTWRDFGYQRTGARIVNRMRQRGTVHRTSFRRDDDGYLRSNPVMVELLLEAKRDIEEGRFIIGSREELDERLARWDNERDL